MTAFFQEVTSDLNFWTLFLMVFFADFLAIFTFWVCVKSADSNIGFLRRVTHWRLNCLALLYEEFKAERVSGLSQEDAYKTIKKKYRNNSLRFMLQTGGADDIAFIGRLLENKEVFYRFMDTNSFTNKEYKEMLRIMNLENSMQIARSSVSSILIDDSSSSVEKAIKWLRMLCVQPFVVDPDIPDRKIGKLENYFSILYYTKGEYLKESVSQDSFLCTMKALARVYPEMKIASSKSHSSKYEAGMRKDDKRKQEMLAVIQKICNE